MTNLSIADRAAVLKDQIDVLTAELDAIKEQAKASGYEQIEGSFAVLKISLAERVSVSTAAVRKLLTDEQFQSVAKVSTYSVVRIDRVKAA